MSKTTVVKFKDGRFGVNVLINAEDFDSDLHEYVSGEKPVEKEELKLDSEENENLKKSLAEAKLENESLKKDISDLQEIIKALKAKPAQSNNDNDKTAKTK